MVKELAAALLLDGFPRQTISAFVELHHFGEFDAATHKLDRPTWVSDDYACALGYRHFAVAAPRYTNLVTAAAFEVVDLNGVRLQEIAMRLSVHDCLDWNYRLAEHLLENGILGLIYSGREILLADPSKVIKATGVCSA